MAVSRIVIQLTGVARASSVRLDDKALRALALLEATGLSRSAAIRFALVTAAARLRDRHAPAAEVAALEATQLTEPKFEPSRS
jgi:shikimate kinase